VALRAPAPVPRRSRESPPKTARTFLPKSAPAAPLAQHSRCQVNISPTQPHKNFFRRNSVPLRPVLPQPVRSRPDTVRSVKTAFAASSLLATAERIFIRSELHCPESQLAFHFFNWFSRNVTGIRGGSRYQPLQSSVSSLLFYFSPALQPVRCPRAVAIPYCYRLFNCSTSPFVSSRNFPGGTSKNQWPAALA